MALSFSCTVEFGIGERVRFSDYYGKKTPGTFVVVATVITDDEVDYAIAPERTSPRSDWAYVRDYQIQLVTEGP